MQTPDRSAHALILQDKLQRAGKRMRIKMLVLDVDGCMTDGGLYYDKNGIALKRYNVQDGAGIKLLRRYGVYTAIVTGNKADAVASRAEDLGIDSKLVMTSISDKPACIEQLLKLNNTHWHETAAIGDDWQDIAHLSLCGISAAPSDAHPEVKAIAQITCSHAGGHGAVRELCDLILMYNNDYSQALSSIRATSTHGLSNT